MTHRDIKYDRTDESKARRAALKDVISWLGYKKYRSLTWEFRKAAPMTVEQFGRYCWIAGIQGYPVNVWYDRVFPKTE